jgi:hypothetical protein
MAYQIVINYLAGALSYEGALRDLGALGYDAREAGLLIELAREG